MDDFTEVYDTRTGVKTRVPAHWLADPILGRFIKKTPSQRALDGELGQAPTEDSTVPQIRAFADKAEIDVTGLTKKDELLGAVLAVVGVDPLPEPGADTGVAVEQTPPGASQDNPVGAPPANDSPTGTDPAGAPNTSTDETPAAGDEEN